MNVLVSADGEGEESAYRGDLNDSAKSFEVVKYSLFIDTLGNKTSFVVVNCAIGVSFEEVYQFAAENVHMRLMGNEAPGTVVK